MSEFRCDTAAKAGPLTTQHWLSSGASFKSKLFSVRIFSNRLISYHYPFISTKNQVTMEKHFGYFVNKYGMADMYTDCFADFETSEERRVYCSSWA